MSEEKTKSETRTSKPENPATPENLAKIMHIGGVELLREFNELLTQDNKSEPDRIIEARLLIEVAEVGYNRKLFDEMLLRTNPEKLKEIILLRIGSEEEAEDAKIESVLDASERDIFAMFEFTETEED